MGAVYLHKLFFLFGLSILCALIFIPLLTANLPGWLFLITLPVGAIIYIVFQAGFDHLTKSFKGSMGKVVCFTICMVGGIVGAMMLELLKSLLG